MAIKAQLIAENANQREAIAACRVELREAGDTISFLNAQLALVTMTYAKARQQLAAQEEKCAAPKKKEISTALGCVLTHDAFFEAQQESAQRQNDVEVAKLAKEQVEKDWKRFQEEGNEEVRLWRVKVAEMKANGEKGRLLKPKMLTKKEWLAVRLGADVVDGLNNVFVQLGSDMDDKEGDD
jgi:hypothetical protein